MELFCGACLRLVNGERKLTAYCQKHLSGDQYFIHHSDTSALWKWADQGCLFCKMICQTLSPLEREEVCRFANRGLGQYEGLNPELFVTSYRVRQAYFQRPTERTLLYRFKTPYEDYKDRVVKQRTITKEIQIVPAKGPSLIHW